VNFLRTLSQERSQYHIDGTTMRWLIDQISEMVFFAGRFPQKTAKEYLKLLDNLESNAEYKGMDLDRLRIVSAVVHRGTKLERFTPRAMGRTSPKIGVLVHVELVAKEGLV